MSKINGVAARLVSELIFRRIMDESAETVAEMATDKGISRATVQREIRSLLAAGKIEKVYKKCGFQTVPAYRVKR